MPHIILSKERFVIVDEEDVAYLIQFKWHYDGHTASSRLNGKKIKMSRFLLNAPSDKFVDHINGNPLDNRKSNLRLCSNAENCRNKKMDTRNTSGYRGVSWSRRNNCWSVYVKFNGRSNFVGYFLDKKLGALAWNLKSRELGGEFARLNVLSFEEGELENRQRTEEVGWAKRQEALAKKRAIISKSAKRNELGVFA